MKLWIFLHILVPKQSRLIYRLLSYRLAKYLGISSQSIIGFRHRASYQISSTPSILKNVWMLKSSHFDVGNKLRLVRLTKIWWHCLRATPFWAHARKLAVLPYLGLGRSYRHDLGPKIRRIMSTFKLLDIIRYYWVTFWFRVKKPVFAHQDLKWMDSKFIYYGFGRS